MFSFRIRFLLVIALTVCGAYQLGSGDLIGIALIASAVLLVFGYFRYGPIRLAFSELRKGNVERVEELLATIHFPHLLSSQSQAYLYWIYGLLDAQHDDRIVSAERNLRIALSLKLRTSNDRCLILTTLAELASRRGDMDEAYALLGQARNIPHKTNTEAYIEQLFQDFHPRGMSE